MCGFLVEYNLKSNGVCTKNKFLDLLELSSKRGPNDQGFLSIPTNLKMGFNRLAILDKSLAGHQPMQSHKKKYTIVFNGEIYNHLELRKKLAFKNFRGHSDTETICACFDEWGIEKTIRILNGMFAIVIFNHLSQELSLVRDFAGIKPLFYGWNGKTLVAASQYDQIINHPEYENASIDPQVLKLYLEQHFLPAPFGLYQNTFQVLPGEILTFKSNGDKNHLRYWELPINQNHFIKKPEEAETHIASKLDLTVENQLIADVPIGAFLSGGVDSSLIASAIKNQHRNIGLFTIGSDSHIHDESERASQFATELNLKHNLWHLNSKEMLGYWDEAMNALHEPIADFSILPTFLVSKLAKHNVTVALSGDGGDELFFGYERFWSIGKNLKFQHYPSIVRKALYGFDKYTTGNKNLNSVLLSSSQSQAHQGLHSRFRIEWLNALAPDLANKKLPDNYSVYDYDNTKDKRLLLQKMRHSEFYGMMQKTLRKVDLASMENSLEVRVPFLDKEMIEASLDIDPLLNFGKYKSKDVLKNILEKRIPMVKREQIKKGFSIPLGDWLRKDLKSMFRERLLDGDLDKFGFQRKVVESMLSKHNREEKDLKWPLFTIYALLK